MRECARVRAFSAHARLVCALALVLSCAHRAVAQDGANVLVVVNTAHAPAERLAARYTRARSVPTDQILRVTTASGDEIDRALYERQIERPIAEWLTARRAQDRILYIALVKGVPLRISGTQGRQGTQASVDSELTLLYRRLVGVRVPIIGQVANPYFLGTRTVADLEPFSHATRDIYLVSRLDGFTDADVEGLIDRGARPSRTGTFLLDGRGADGERVAEGWLRAAATAIAGAGYKGRVELDTTPAAIRNRRALLGYASWGSNDPGLRSRRSGLGFLPGALATTFVSTDARTVVEPAETWQPGAPGDPVRGTADSGQSLAADLIRDGVTGTAGYVAEPFLDGTLRPDILFAAYVAGANLIEAFHLATPVLSWQSVVFGDPLCAPFRTRVLPPEEARPALDPETELPRYFSERRVAQLTSTGLPAAAVKLMLRGDERRRQGDRLGSRQALEQATALEPKLAGAQRLLAATYEELGEHALAIERYRRVLDAVPDDLLALNNLAYALAVHGGAPREALDLARKAHTLSKGKVPSITDTLGWVHHLLGEHAEAEKYLTEAAAAAPDAADVQLHLAHVHLARGRKDLAARAVARVLAIDAKLAERADVKALRAKLGATR